MGEPPSRMARSGDMTSSTDLRRSDLGSKSGSDMWRKKSSGLSNSASTPRMDIVRKRTSLSHVSVPVHVPVEHSKKLMEESAGDSEEASMHRSGGPWSTALPAGLPSGVSSPVPPGSAAPITTGSLESADDSRQMASVSGALSPSQMIAASTTAIPGPSKHTFGKKMVSMATKVRPIRERKKKVKDGVVVFKGHPSWSIVLAIQFGLKHTSDLLNLHPPKDLTPLDFEDELIFHFDAAAENERTVLDVNEHTKWEHHAPFVYRRIRELFGITDDIFLGSIVQESKVRELPTPGRSGALFYITEDEQFFIKTISGHEEKRLDSFLNEYYEHIVNNPQTLLTRFLASFSMRTTRGRHIRMVAMSSIFRDGLYIDEKYDLKGSTKGRRATAAEKEKENVTLKDLDFDRPLHFDTAQLKALFDQLEKDTLFLDRQNIMDYSLLVGLSEVLPEDDGVLEGPFMANGEAIPWYTGYQSDVAESEMNSGETPPRRKYRLSMGIIDILQTFSSRKKAEYSYKVMQTCYPSSVSVNPPSKYRQRFMSFLRTRFIELRSP